MAIRRTETGLTGCVAWGAVGGLLHEESFRGADTARVVVLEQIEWSRLAFLAGFAGSIRRVCTGQTSRMARYTFGNLP